MGVLNSFLPGGDFAHQKNCQRFLLGGGGWGVVVVRLGIMLASSISVED